MISMWYKIFGAVVAILIFVLGHIIIARTASSRTLAVVFSVELITVFEILMIFLSRFIVWKTFIPLLISFISTGQCSGSTDVSEKSHRPLRKSKNSEVDIAAMNQPEEGQSNLTIGLGKIALLTYLGLCHLSYITNLFLIDTEPHWLSMLAYACFGSYIQLITGICMLKLLLLALGLLNKMCNSSHSPRIQKYTPLIAVIYMIAASSCGLYTASQPPGVKHVDVPVKNLPANLEGLHIVQLSDIHLGPTVGLSKLSKIVEIVNQEKPDIIVLTGDLVDASVGILSKAAEPLRELKSKYGRFFVSGNHEYYTGDVDNWFIYLRSLGFTVLHNDNVKVPATVAEGEGQICIAGTDDIQADRIGYTGHKFDLSKAVSSCSSSSPVLLLAHQPLAAKLALDSQYRIDLVLSGHTHGGQMFPLIFGAYLLNPFYAGLYQYGDKGGYVYVSQGTQYWGIPMRIATSMEITRIVLHRLV